MRGAFRIARFFGIDLKVHLTFFLIILFVGLTQHTLGGLAMGIGQILLLFLCVTLHEFGHALVALRYGIPVREIVLLPIGGVAVMARIPENPKQELWIAVAGPLVNVAILAVIVPVWWWVTGGVTGPAELYADAKYVFSGMSGAPAAVYLLSTLLYANAMLIAFNMIPAFPLDGGRVFRAVLAFFIPHAKATRIAATVGQVAAVGLAVWGLMHGNLVLVVLAVFIFMGAGAESSVAQAGTVLATRRVGDAYNKTAITLTMDDRVSHVIEHLLTSYQPDFAVVNRGRLAGVVTREDVLKWLAETPSMYDVYVTEVMREEPQVLRVDAKLSLDEVVHAMDERDARVAAVFDADHYLGLVSTEDIAEAQAVLTFLNRRLAGGAPAPRGSWPVPMQKVPRA